MLLTLRLHRALCLSGIAVRVLVDDVDVTHECVAADNVYGYASCLLRAPDGRRFCAAIDRAGRTTVASVLRTGAVRFVTPHGDLPARWTAQDWFTFPRASAS